MSSQARRIVLTGGAGFIGSHVAEALLREGAHLTVIDNLDDFYSPEWENEAARTLYTSLGYQAVGERRGFHKA